MTVGSERLAINPSLGDGVDSLVVVEAHQFGDDRSRSHLDEDDVIEADAVEGVEEGKASLNLMRLDHGLKDIANSERLTLAGEVIGHSEDGTQVIGRMTPLSSKEAIIVVEPTDGSSDVEGSTDGVELIVGSRDAGAVRDHGTLHDGSQEFSALGEPQGFEPTADRVDEAEPGGLEGKLRVDLVVVNIVGNVLEDLVGLWADGRFAVVES